MINPLGFYIRFVLPFLIAAAPLLTSCASNQRETLPPHGIVQILGWRDGAPHVQGFRIQFHDRRLVSTIPAAQISIVEAKYGRDLKALMNWEVSPDGSVLTAHFKPGMGDFGSGNTVTVSLYPRCLAANSPPTLLEWELPTDPL